MFSPFSDPTHRYFCPSKQPLSEENVIISNCSELHKTIVPVRMNTIEGHPQQFTFYTFVGEALGLVGLALRGHGDCEEGPPIVQQSIIDNPALICITIFLGRRRDNNKAPKARSAGQTEVVAVAAVAARDADQGFSDWTTEDYILK